MRSSAASDVYKRQGQVRDFHLIKNHIGRDEFATITDITSAYSMISIMGPNARQVLSQITPADLSNEAFPFGTSQMIEAAYAHARATRMTYVGELGWELYIPTEFTLHIYDALVEAGGKYDLKHCGMHAMNSLRLEKGYRHWGHDISDEETPVEAGLRFAVKFDKGDFLGREVLLKQKEEGVTKRLVQFALEDPEPLMYHNEPIYRNGELAGYITSGMYGHAIGTCLGMGYVNNPDGLVNAKYIREGSYEIEVADKRYAARASLRPFYDPKSLRTKM